MTICAVIAGCDAWEDIEDLIFSEKQSLGEYFSQNMACIVRRLILFDFLRGFLCPFGSDLYPFYFDDPIFTWIFMMLLL